MRKQVKTIALALLAAMAFSTGYANETVETEGPKTYEVGMYFDHNSGLIKTFIEKEAGNSLTISFEDEKGNVLESTSVKKKEEKGMIAFDVNALPDGTYQLKLNDGQNKSVHSLEISRPKPVQVVKFQ
ncbi:hypothetical protein [Jiulongibacter sediminis]|jgi:flagellar hook assembly protein FlgD|uniref:Secretion system C-terminal sorting domain-containing protein n=1 Tax=Jiulongibacter sediminis TaxID=1605367 RepID=A0A0P7C777_9BACT|nr:hypothetical protein [Jiulongibacter sediminis]KPM48239.1 hypothetical protein AFM12_06145 [Jiulongibacter sediminis]TBX24781.1 hypothetical protein TK44_06150 [Jiulongibacter sediminis]